MTKLICSKGIFNKDIPILCITSIKIDIIEESGLFIPRILKGANTFGTSNVLFVKSSLIQSLSFFVLQLSSCRLKF